MFNHFFRGHNRPLGVKRVMNTQNERREKSQENKLVAACSLVIQSSHLLKPERVLCSILTREAIHAQLPALTGPAGKTASPAKRRRNVLWSRTLFLWSAEKDIQLPGLAGTCRSDHLAPFGSDSTITMQTFDCHFASHRDFATEERMSWPVNVSPYHRVHPTLSELKKSNS